jgi:hypothetical protein
VNSLRFAEKKPEADGSTMGPRDRLTHDLSGFACSSTLRDLSQGTGSWVRDFPAAIATIVEFENQPVFLPVQQEPEWSACR